MDVLQFNFTSDLRQVVLTGPWKFACRSVCRHLTNRRLSGKRLSYTKKKHLSKGV